jgi:hypothetical protein
MDIDKIKSLIIYEQIPAYQKSLGTSQTQKMIEQSTINFLTKLTKTVMPSFEISIEDKTNKNSH